MSRFAQYGSALTKAKTLKDGTFLYSSGRGRTVVLHFDSRWSCLCENRISLHALFGDASRRRRSRVLRSMRLPFDATRRIRNARSAEPLAAVMSHRTALASYYLPDGHVISVADVGIRSGDRLKRRYITVCAATEDQDARERASEVWDVKPRALHGYAAYVDETGV